MAKSPKIFPKYDRGEVDRSARKLIDTQVDLLQYIKALDIVNNWRSCHETPLHTFYVWLNRQSKKIDSSSLVARRIKRLPSIEAKLIRMPNLKFSKMQDIGGCRAILRNVAKVNELVKKYKQSDLKHKLIKENDYIKFPKETGYRGVHLVYSYNSDKTEKWNGLSVEVQLRSKIQHAWATAVEIFGTFTKQSLKTNQGSDEWLRFFALMSSALAIKEKMPLVPNTPADPQQLYNEICALAKKLHIKETLETYGSALKTSLEDPMLKKADYFILVLKADTREVEIEGFKSSELKDATTKFNEIEQKIKKEKLNDEAVLVAVESISTLKRAYPNYFLDTKSFIQELDDILKKSNK